MSDYWEDLAANTAKEDKERTAQAAARNVALQNRQPKNVAEARRLSSMYGVTPALVEANPTPFVERDNQVRVENTVIKHPWMAQPLQDPDFAALATPLDLQKIGTMMGAFGIPSALMGSGKPDPKRVGWSAGDYDRAALGLTGRAIGTVAHGLTGIIQTGVEPIAGALGFGDQTLAYFNRDAANYQRKREALMPEDLIDTQAKKAVFGGLESLVTMLIPLGAVSKGKLLASLTGVTYGNAYSKYREKGAGKLASIGGGGAEAAIEYWTERGPLDIITNKLGKGTAKDLLWGYLGKDIIGEQIATAGQDAVEQFVAPDEGKTWADYVNERPDAAISTLISTATMFGAIGGVDIAKRITDRVYNSAVDANDSVEAMQGQAYVDQLMTSAQSVELRTTSPDDFARFVNEGAKDSPVKNVYLPIETVDAILADETTTEDEREALTLYQDQIEEARLNNGEVVIPIGDAAASFAGTPLWDKMKDDARVLPGGISAREAKTKMEGLIAELEAVGNQAMEEAQALAPAILSKGKVYQEVKAQVLAAGRGAKEAQTTALLFASRAENLASARYGKFDSPEAAWKWMQLKIVGADAKVPKGKKATLKQVEPIRVYHGGPGVEGDIRAPFYVSPNKAFANSYALDRGRGAGKVEAFDIAPSKIAEEKDIQAAAKKAGLSDADIATMGGGFLLDANFSEAADATIAELKRKGFDAARFNDFAVDEVDKEETTYAVFDPAKISRQGPPQDADGFPAEDVLSSEGDGTTDPLSLQQTAPAEALVAAMQGTPDGLEVDLGSDRNGGVTLHNIRTSKRGEGLASGYMRKLTAEADRLGVRIDLEVGPSGMEEDRDDADGPPLEFSDLVDFYMSHGFDWTGDGPVMAREPVRAYQQGPRGEATFYPDGRTVIQLFKADFSTMLHEMSHVFLQQEYLLAKEPTASPELKADIEALDKWFKANGQETGDTPPVGAHELFARTAERYFREGKAPSAELRSAFSQFREWLTGVYKSVKDLLVYGPAPINPEISAILDRMIATSEAIEVNATAPMSQDDLGMTSAEYAAYLDSVGAARDQAFDILLERMMKAIRRREDAKMREQRANVRAEVATQVNADPRFVALHLLRTGRWLGEPDRAATPVKLDTKWLGDNYGGEIYAKLPVGLQPLHREDGVKGDDIADMVGIPSGDALVKDLLDLKAQADALKAEGNPRPLRDHIIETEVDRIMAERHGDIAMSDADIQEEAIAALNANRQGEVLATELRQLKKQAGSGVVTPYQLLREWARRKVNEGSVDDAVSKSALQRYIRAFNKARSLFEEAILGGKPDEAIKQKQAQMINHALLAEGKKVADEINVIVRRMNRYANTKAMASIDQDYMDRIHELLEGYNFRNVTNIARAEQASFEAWAEGQRAQGHEVHVPDRFRDERTNWKDAKVAKLLELNDMVQSLVAQGKLKQRLITKRGEIELAAIVDDAESRILNLPARTRSSYSTGEEDPSFRQSWREAKTAADYRRAITNLFSRPGARSINTGLVKMEGLMDVLDGTKDGTGPLNQNVTRGATEAANEFSRLMEEVMEPLIARYKLMSGKQSQRMRDRVTLDQPGRTLTLNVSIHELDTEKLGEPLNIPRMKLIGLILNTGNLSNLSKLVGGERWGDPDSATDLARVRDILVSYASKEDMDLVQDIWTGVSKLWPHIARVERELSGVVPEEVVPIEFDTPHGPYQGGYWPVVWDSTRSEMGKKQGEEAETSLQGVGFGISTPKGHTITRTGAMAPMDWSVEKVLFSHMTKVISRVAYAPWVRDTLKIVDNKRITGAIRLRLGDEYVAAIKPWIRDQIPSNIQDVVGAKFLEKWLEQFRINMSIAVLGISFTTGVAQTLGLGYAAGILGEGKVGAGPKWVGVGFREMIRLQKKGGLGGAQEFVFARSEEMQRRAHEINQESVDVFRRLKDKDTLYRKAQAFAFWHIGFIDLNMVSIPVWLGGYHKAISEGLSDADASAYAEKTVRLSQGSGRKKDLAAVQRGNAGQKLVTMFYTPSSVFFNQQWEGAQALKGGNWSKALAPTFWFLTASTIAEAMLSGDWPEDDEEDGIGGLDVTEWVARNMMFGLFYGIPFARDAANAGERKLTDRYATYGNTPIQYAAETISKGARSSTKMMQGEELTGSDIKAQVNATLFLLGLPASQPAKAAGYIEDVRDGKEQPDGAYDWYEGLAYGSQPKK